MTTLLDIGAGRVVTVSTFYNAVELLGVGRYSEVYKAFDRNSQTDVALKMYVGFDEAAHSMARAEEAMLSRIGALNSEYFPRKLRSARAHIQNRNHPLIVLELGSYVGSDGQKRVIPLKDIIPEVGASSAQTTLDPEFWAGGAVVRWVIQLVQAVKQLHELGVIHRDIKPTNILIKRGAGLSISVPLLLDFNSAVSGNSLSSVGTLRYLPPEVTAGERKEPAISDDLWAIAMIAWELIHGLGSSPENAPSQHPLIIGSVSEQILDVLRQALVVKAETRYQSANDLLVALESALHDDTESVRELTSNEVSQARRSMERIRLAMWQSLVPPGEIFVPKEIDDSVTTAIAWLSQEDTQSLDLVSEIVRLGPWAIPVCLQQGFRLAKETLAHRELVEAIIKLASVDMEYAQKSIDRFVLSSNKGVRSLCWTVCEGLQYFPQMMLTSLTSDEGLLLPEERIRMADLCIRFSSRRSAVIALIKYMCREYILDQNKYKDLSGRVARKLHELQYRNSLTTAHTDVTKVTIRDMITPLLLKEETESRVWRSLTEFQELQVGEADEVEQGLLELMAEAFAATGAGGLKVLKAWGETIPGSGKLPIFRRFAAKLALSNTDARDWLTTQAPVNREAKKALDSLVAVTGISPESPDQLLAEYLATDSRLVFNSLRFFRTNAVLNCVKAYLCTERTSDEQDRILKLLKGHKSRLRPAIVDVLLTHWTVLSKRDFHTAMQVLGSSD
jgi:serine/threonine protein kinase